MSYTVTINNQTITVYPGTVDTSTDLGLIGKNVPNYGQIIAQNFLSLLANFAGNTAPSNPIQGELWYDTGANQLRYFNGSVYKSIRGFETSSTMPSNPSVGDMWLDTQHYQLKIYTGNVSLDATGWLTIGPEHDPRDGKSGFYAETVTDTNTVDHTVFIGYLTGVPVSLISKDIAFTLQTPINGISAINPGINSIIGTVSDSNGSISNQINNLRTEMYANATHTVSMIGNAIALQTSPILTGFPRTAEPSLGNVSNMIATTRFVSNTLANVTAIVNNLSNFVANSAPLNSPVFTGTPAAPTPAVNDHSDTLATTNFVHSLLPLGSIILWYGDQTNIPNGWLLCDGQNSTPDLRDQVVIGAGGSYPAGTPIPSSVANSYVSGTQILTPSLFTLCYIMKVS